MAVRVELTKSFALLVIGAVMGVGVYVAFVAPTSDASASHSGFPEVDDTPMVSSLSGGGMDDTSARRLEGVDDVPFTQNATNTRCAQWSEGDRLFVEKGVDLPTCYAECSKRERCNHFAFALTGWNAGKCIGCEEGLTEAKEHFVFYTMKRSDEENETTLFSCPDGSVSTVDLDAVVDGDRPYELCVTEEGEAEPICVDLRNGDQATAMMTLCTASSSTSTSTMTTRSTSTSTMTTGSSSSTSTSTMTTDSSSSTSTSTMTTGSSSSTSTSTTTTDSSSSTSTASTTTIASSTTSTTTSHYVWIANSFTIRSAASLWLEDKNEARAKYGDIRYWDTSLVRNMMNLFFTEEPTDFNDDISAWDVSQVGNMEGMFSGILGFKQDLSAWDVRNVANMRHMFSRASDFDVVLSGWDVSNVVDMSGMFSEASNFHVDLSGWNPINLVWAGYMFYGAVDADVEDITGWNVGKVYDMSYMFANTPFNQDISSWNVGSVVMMTGMFESNTAFNRDLPWDVSNVRLMENMFAFAAAFNGNISTWNVKQVENMKLMFFEAQVFNQDISGWDIRTVVTLEHMFYGAESFLDADVSVWQPDSVQDNARQRFISCESIAVKEGDWTHWGDKKPQCFMPRCS